MTVQVQVIECGRGSEGKTSRNKLTSCSINSISIVSISLLEVGRVGTRKTYEEILTNSRYSRHVFASVNCLMNLKPIMILSFSGGTMTLRRAPVSRKVKQ